MGKDISNVVVGLVEGCEPIPETHLHVCQVNAGEHGTMQICCGADNVHTGRKFPVRPSWRFCLCNRQKIIRPSRVL